ncbi:RNA polymerase sigma factor [Planctomicrobium sp. SH664]|uniref:RNA polymerase sigma factor n=1 Tax=Planctomicrobium sp. SH664 TaxID=3448125 RepID=UPI003F5B55A7
MNPKKTSDPEFDVLLQRMRSGSQLAISEVVKQFSPTVYGMIRRRIAQAVRTVTDSEDVAQSVWRSFFEGLDQQYLIQSPEQLRALLGKMASNKAVDCGRRHFARQQHGETIKQPVDTVPLPSTDPSPSEVLMAKECLSKIVKSVPPRFAQAVSMRAQGIPVETIARTLQLPLRSLTRIFERARIKNTQ